MCKCQGRTVLSPVMELKWRTGIVVEVCQTARAESHHLHRNSMIFSSFKEVFIFLQAGFLGTTILTSHVPIPLHPLPRPPCWNYDWLDLQVVSCIKLLSTITMPYPEGSSWQLSSPIHLIYILSILSLLIFPEPWMTRNWYTMEHTMLFIFIAFQKLGICYYFIYLF